nr:Chain P, HIV-1 gp120 third variable region (V3) crown [Human immunodeficiency virus 1]3MLV_Q Chain Q, HIV-1 gp120 third variable region (V3) crown [Human immunodeficiency virus 1]
NNTRKRIRVGPGQTVYATNA